jgi:hypothetical protein
VYVCDNTGHLKRKFKRDSCRIPSLRISEQNQIITPSDDHKAVYMFTEKGNLQSTMKLPEGHWFRGVAFHHVIGKIVSAFFKDSSVVGQNCQRAHFPRPPPPPPPPR